MDRLIVTPAALWELTAAARRAASAVEPSPLTAACAQAVGGLGPLASATVLAELATHLAQAVAAVQVRWWQLVTATDAAAERYAGLEAAIVRAVGTDDAFLLPPPGSAGSLLPSGGVLLPPEGSTP